MNIIRTAHVQSILNVSCESRRHKMTPILLLVFFNRVVFKYVWLLCSVVIFHVCNLLVSCLSQALCKWQFICPQCFLHPSLSPLTPIYISSFIRPCLKKTFIVTFALSSIFFPSLFLSGSEQAVLFSSSSLLLTPRCCVATAVDVLLLAFPSWLNWKWFLLRKKTFHA